MEELDSRARDLLRLVVTAAAGESVTFDDTARELDRGPEELLLAVRRINESSAAAGRPQVLGLGKPPAGSDSNDIGLLPYVLAEGLAALLMPNV